MLASLKDLDSSQAQEAEDGKEKEAEAKEGFVVASSKL